MQKTVLVISILGFIVIDWLIFHDFLKTGETYTFTEYLTGVLSIVVISSNFYILSKK
jgi:hypothetical protein